MSCDSIKTMNILTDIYSDFLQLQQVDDVTDNRPRPTSFQLFNLLAPELFF